MNGADDEMIEQLDQGLRNFAEVTSHQYNNHFEHIKGSGAAGGLGYGLCAYLNGQLMPGIQIIFDKVDLETKAKDADLIITGEGKIDFQSSMGKVLTGISELGRKYNIPVVGLAGSVTDDAYKLHDLGITSLFSIMNYPMTLDEAMDKEKALDLTRKNVTELFRVIKYIK